MADLAPYPNVKAALIVLLSGLADVSTATGPDLINDLPFLRVDVTGGRDNTVTDLSRVTVDAFALTEDGADDLAELVRQRLTCKPHLGLGFVLDRCDTDSRPQTVPWTDSPPPWRTVASYSVTARRSTP